MNNSLDRNEIEINVTDLTPDDRVYEFIEKAKKRNKLGGINDSTYKQPEEEHGFVVNELYLIINETDILVNHE